MYRGMTIRLLHDPPVETILATARAAQDAGANLIALVPHHYVLLGAHNEVLEPPWTSRYVWSDYGQAPGLTANTTPLLTVRTAAQQIRALGMQVLIKPHVDPGYLHDGVYGVGGWRFYISVKDIYHTPALYRSRAITWHIHYRAMLTPYIAMARQTGSWLSLGCELGSITRELGAQFWIELAHWVRRDQGFTGLLTYSANWGEEVTRLAALWQDPALDFIGCDWYVPSSSWNDQQAALRALERTVRKYTLFTEVGYPNRADCFSDPSRDPLPTDVPSDPEQLIAWRAFQVEWGKRSYVAWEGPIPGMPDPPITHNVLRTPALSAQVLGDLR